MVYIAVSKYVTTHRDLTTVSVSVATCSMVMDSHAQVRVQDGIIFFYNLRV